MNADFTDLEAPRHKSEFSTAPLEELEKKLHIESRREKRQTL
jgi:hypothetical protein